MKSPRKPSKPARPAEQRPPDKLHAPLKPQRTLFIAASAVFVLWVLVLLAMYLLDARANGG